MWLITTTGFYSIVQKPGEKDLTIRSRVRKDLEALRDKYLPDLGEIVRNENTDYRYRAKVSPEKFAEAAAQMVRDIDYDNFKNTVAQVQGHRRSHIYSGVWRTSFGFRTRGTLIARYDLGVQWGQTATINYLSLQLFFQNIQALKAHLEPLLLCERH